MERIKLLIVEDEAPWIKLLEMLFKIEGDLEIVAAVTNENEVYEIINNNEIDIILMDINLSDNHLDGVYIAAEISQLTRAKIIMLTSLDPKEVALDSFNAGAVEFVAKSEYKKLPQTIRNVMAKNVPMEELLKDYRRLKQQEILSCLSQEEQEVLALMEKDYTDLEITKKLEKPQPMINKQIGRILDKLGVNSVKEALNKIKYRGLYKG